MPNTFPRRLLALVTSLGLLLLPVAAAAEDLPCNLPEDPPGVDNRDNYQVFYEEDVVHPMELTKDASELWALNLPDASVEIFDLANPADPVLDGRVAVGMGPVSIRRRPIVTTSLPNEVEPRSAAVEIEPQPRPEMWVACQSSNSVFVIDVADRRVVAAVETLHEPSGIAFNADGNRAYVTLSASNQIAEIDTAGRAVIQLIEFRSRLPVTYSGDLRVHAEQPRAVLHHADGLDVLVFKSGNGSTRNPFPVQDIFHDIVNLWDDYPNLFGGIPIEPPDREVLRFDLQDPSVANAVAWRQGTLNFDLHRLQDGRLLISTVDLLNDQRIGEPEYHDEGFARHLIAITPPSQNGQPNLNDPGREVIDLNADLQGSLTGYSCATPTEVALSADESTLWVACYESAATAVVDLAAKKVTGFLRSTPVPAAGLPFGPRGVVLNEAAGKVYVYNRGDSTLQTFPATTTGAVDPLDTDGVGFDITPDDIVAGRFHHVNAKNSGDGAVSCNTCHMDGHLDGLAWDLGAFTGNLDDFPQDVAQDAKRLRVTMSLRGIEETNPLHWRGDRADFKNFNPAFAGLLGGSELTDEEFADFQRFIYSLSYPANPKQALDRVYSDDALRGFECFVNTPAHDITFDEVGTTRDVTCGDCHDMRGFSGTNNQVNNDIHFEINDDDGDGFLDSGPLAEDATQLRGLFDKESDLTWAYSLDDDGTTETVHQVPATGWGFGSVSFNNTDTVAQFEGLNVFDLHNPVQKEDIVTFLDELDTGSAPTTARAVELDPGDLTMVTALELGARRGDNDLIVRGDRSYLYDPGSGLYVPDSANLPPVPRSTLEAFVSGGPGQQLFFVGVPVGTGYRNIDREMDYLLDADEAGVGASLLSADTDGDDYPDGYEVRFHKNPADPADFPGPETVPPTILPGAHVAWVNSTVAKVRWETDEESVSRARVFDPAGNLVWLGEDLQFKKKHVMVVRNLRPSPVGGPPAVYKIELEAEDPANGAAPGNKSSLSLTTSPQAHLFQSTHIAQTTLQVIGGVIGGGQKLVRVRFKVVDEDGNAVPGAKVKFSLAQWVPGSGQPATVTNGHVTGPADSQGFAAAVVTTQPTPITIEAIGRQVVDPATSRLYFHPLNGQFGFHAQLAIP